MTFSCLRVAAVAAALAFSGSAWATPVAAPLDIELLFDSAPDYALTAPFLGFGLLHMDVDPGDGEHLFSDLQGLDFSVAFPLFGFAFTLDDMVTDPTQAILQIGSLPGGDRTARFGVTPEGSVEPFMGSLYFEIPEIATLLFEPGFGLQYMIAPGGLAGAMEGDSAPGDPPLFAEYGVAAEVSAVPVPPAAAAMVVGVAAFGALRRRRRAA